MERCLCGHTQNANESFNATVWRLVPKHLHCGLKTIEIGAFIAAGIFNEGYSAVLKIMQLLDFTIGHNCKIFSDKYDNARYIRQERRSLSATREARIAQKKAQTELKDFYEEEEGLLYAPGIAD